MYRYRETYMCVHIHLCKCQQLSDSRLRLEDTTPLQALANSTRLPPTVPWAAQASHKLLAVRNSLF